MQTTTFSKALSIAALAAVLAACGGQKDSAPAAAFAASPAVDNGATGKEVIFDTTIGDFDDIVGDQIQPALEKKGYTVRLVKFTGYVRPNLVLAEGELDINVFQHKPCLDDFKKEHKLDVTEAFQVPTVPLGLYPDKLKLLDEVKDGSSVPASNDPSNFTRTLVMLNELDWVKLKDGVNPLTASRADIAKNPKNIRIIKLEAAQLSRSRADVDFAVVNSNYAMSNGMKLTEALFQEPSFVYVNWAAIRAADKDSQRLKDIAETYNSSEFKTYARRRFEDYKYPAAQGENAAVGAKVEAASAASATK